MQSQIVPILIYIASAVGLAVFLLVLGNVLNPRRPGEVKRMPYESGMDPVHDTRRRFDVRFHLMAIAFLVFDVELLFLYPWAVAIHRSRPAVSVAWAGAAGQASTRAMGGAARLEAGLGSRGGPDAAAAVAGVAPGAVSRGPVAEPASNRPSGPGPRGGLADAGVRPAFVGGLIFVGLLVLGLVYDWKKGVFQWR